MLVGGWALACCPILLALYALLLGLLQPAAIINGPRITRSNSASYSLELIPNSEFIENL